MEVSSGFDSSFSSTNDLNLSPSRKRTVTKGKTINPNEGSETCQPTATSNMVTKTTKSCQTLTEFYYHNIDDTLDDTKAETGSSNLLVEHGMEQAYQKFFGRKTKESLSSFLTHLPGLVDVPGNANEGLQALINKPPIGGKELVPVSGHQLAGFRLNPGPVPDQFKFVNQQPSKKKHKHKKHKKDHTDGKAVEEKPKSQEGTLEKKSKKSKKQEDGEKKKKKKEKRKKKEKAESL